MLAAYCSNNNSNRVEIRINSRIKINKINRTSRISNSYETNNKRIKADRNNSGNKIKISKNSVSLKHNKISINRMLNECWML